MGSNIRNLTVDFEFEKLFPKNDPDITFYQEHLKHFAYDNDYLMIIAENEGSAFDSTFLYQIKNLTQALANLESVTSVNAPTRLQQLVKTPLGISAYPILHIDQPARYRTDSIRVYNHPIYRSLFSADGQALMLIIQHQHFTDPTESNELVKTINQLTKNLNLPQVRVVGKIAAQETFASYIRTDFLLFFGLALLVSLLLLVALFRSLRIAMIPFAVGITSLVWLLGTMALMGKSISILGSLIPPVILFVSTSDAIHLINAFKKSKAKTKNSRLQEAANKVFIPTLMTSITTAIGFASLWLIETEPIQDFGIFCAVGTLYAFVASYLFIPIALPPSIVSKDNNQQSLLPLARWLLRSPKWIYGSFVLLIAVSALGFKLLKVDAYLLEDLPKEDSTRLHFEYVDHQFGGSKPWEMAFWPANDASLWDRKVMQEAEKIHHYLKEEYTISGLLSPVSLIKYGYQMNHGGANDYFSFPDEKAYPDAVRNIRRISQTNPIKSVIDTAETYGRFTGFIPEYGSLETTKRNSELLAFLDNHIDQSIINYQLTGTTFLIDKSHELLSVNLLKGLLIAIVLIGITLGLFFRSLKIVVLSLIPNIIPLIVTAGIMGMAGFSLKLTTSIIFAVTFGIAVDDSIHFIAAYRENKHKNPLRKCLETFINTGHSIILTTLIIVCGFVLFLFSDFGATYFTGLFLCIALMTALITDLTLLPLLLIHSENKGAKKWLRNLWRTN